MFAFVDETGNTGRNIFDETQPDFLTAALVTRTNFDMTYGRAIRSVAEKIKRTELHGTELGIGRIEEIARDLLKVLKKADARFFVSRVEKKYLLASKIFDTIFDSGENAAVAWHNYNVRPMRIILAFKVAALVDYELAFKFWNSLLEKKEEKAQQLMAEVCQDLLDRVDTLPDKRSREVISEALIWARDHPETLQFHNDKKLAQNGHMPNMVAFVNLLDGLEKFSQKWNRPVRRITHDTQDKFKRNLLQYHEMLSNASPEPIHRPGETIVFQKVAGSEFDIKSDHASAGIQVADVILWLFSRINKGDPMPTGCARLMNYVFQHAYMSDFSFKGVSAQIKENFGKILDTPLSPEKEKETREMLELAEKRRLEEMRQYEKDRLPPFMRDRPELSEKSKNANES